MNKVLILGAGIYQVPLIMKAKEQGIYTIVCSIEGDYPGFKIADKSYFVDTTDIDNILNIAIQENIDGIVTAGTDVPITTIGKVCDELGLYGLSYDSAQKSTIKTKMKDAFIEEGVRTAKYVTCYDDQQAKEALSILTMPVIFKAVDSSGSRGIIKVESNDNTIIRQAIEIIKTVTKKEYFIVEEYIEGTEFGAQALICNGKLKFFMPHGDYVFKGDTGVPIGHFVPYNLDKSIIDDAKLQLEGAIKALNLNNCAINADFILNNQKVYVLEIGARSGATCLAEMVSIAYNIDYYKAILDVALKGSCDDFSQKEIIPSVAKLIISDKNGIISDILLPETRNEDIVEISVDYKVGDYVNQFKVGPDRIGDVIVKGKSLESAQSLMNKVMSELEIKINEK